MTNSTDEGLKKKKKTPKNKLKKTAVEVSINNQIISLTKKQGSRGMLISTEAEWRWTEVNISISFSDINNLSSMDIL